MEELWGKIFERRGSITIDNMPNSELSTLRRLSTEHLLELVRSEGDRSVRGLLAQMEWKRRQDGLSRVAIAISIVALIVSALKP